MVLPVRDMLRPWSVMGTADDEPNKMIRRGSSLSTFLADLKRDESDVSNITTPPLKPAESHIPEFTRQHSSLSLLMDDLAHPFARVPSVLTYPTRLGTSSVPITSSPVPSSKTGYSPSVPLFHKETGLAAFIPTMPSSDVVDFTIQPTASSSEPTVATLERTPSFELHQSTGVTRSAARAALDAADGDYDAAALCLALHGLSHPARTEEPFAAMIRANSDLAVEVMQDEALLPPQTSRSEGSAPIPMPRRRRVSRVFLGHDKRKPPSRKPARPGVKPISKLETELGAVVASCGAVTARLTRHRRKSEKIQSDAAEAARTAHELLDLGKETEHTETVHTVVKSATEVASASMGCAPMGSWCAAPVSLPAVARDEPINTHTFQAAVTRGELTSLEPPQCATVGSFKRPKLRRKSLLEQQLTSLVDGARVVELKANSIALHCDQENALASALNASQTINDMQVAAANQQSHWSSARSQISAVVN